MDNNLVSLNYLRDQLKNLEDFSMSLNGEVPSEISELKSSVSNFFQESALFMEKFFQRGWCLYESMDFNLVQRVNSEYEKNGIDKAERILLDYFKNDVREKVHWIKKSSNIFSDRSHLIDMFFEEHFKENYICSVPLGLIIVDGAVNDFTKSKGNKGLFAKGLELDAWDSFVGSNKSLKEIVSIFNSSRNKTNKDEIRLPYRNGILHGRDINFGNEYVSCKCVSLLFAVADWMQLKNTEVERKNNFVQSQTNESHFDLISRCREQKKFDDEIANWKRRDVIIGTDIPISGVRDDFFEYPYLHPILAMFDYWRDENYGKLSKSLEETKNKNTSSGKWAGQIRKIFSEKKFKSFEFIKIDERTYVKSDITVKVEWEQESSTRTETLRFNCVYFGLKEDDNLVAPRRENGEWRLIPLDVEKIFY
ncbi:TPA: hypothetical protein U1B15_001696 [Streptococcus suis]|uniref:hypothetical protein n=1 Tax=Streptococcus suis TaxID=1307 RepID=UPI001C9C10D7|nr:hypothetical protein [Streptococcus suis]QZS51691.1 hypothetical protein K6976_02535 [Streptococcus suis]QZS61397.1 hypothetical protein K6972_02640 [Streptococcus suis]HEM3429107.1 hypothetical protein [Streptococcus suis]HEM3451754.1 hypothetical protein [Streptococcus suis]HEM3462055.1 hypothetical protein [Streptococcus suis]